MVTAATRELKGEGDRQRHRSTWLVALALAAALRSVISAVIAPAARASLMIVGSNLGRRRLPGLPRSAWLRTGFRRWFEYCRGPSGPCCSARLCLTARDRGLPDLPGAIPRAGRPGSAAWHRDRSHSPASGSAVPPSLSTPAPFLQARPPYSSSSAGLSGIAAGCRQAAFQPARAWNKSRRRVPPVACLLLGRRFGWWTHGVAFVCMRLKRTLGPP